MSERRPRHPLVDPYRETDPGKLEAAIERDYRQLFQTALGARVLAHILHESSMFASTLSTDRVNRDMIDGKREMALSICERAGYLRGGLPVALLTDDLRNAMEADPYDDPGDSDDPLYPRGDDDDPILTGDD